MNRELRPRTTPPAGTRYAQAPVPSGVGSAASHPHVRDLHQFRGLGVVDVFSDRPILDTADGFVDDEERHQEPLPRPDGITEAVGDPYVQLRSIENAVDEIFELHAVDAVEGVRRDDLNLCQQKGRVEAGAGDTGFNLGTGDPNLVQYVPVGGDHGVVGLAPQDVDGAGRRRILGGFVTEQRPNLWIADDARGGVAVEGALERAQQDVAFRSVVVDDAQ